MKMQSTRLLSPHSEENITSFTTSSQDASAKDLKKKRAAIFSAADLWNVERQRKWRKQRRYF